MKNGKVLLASENSRTALTASFKDGEEARKFPQVLAAFLATLSALSMGMCLSWTSPAIPMLQHQSGISPVLFHVNDQQAAWIGSIITLGACLGAIPTGIVTNKIGPKRTLQLVALPLFSSWIMIAFGQSVWILYAARFLAGTAAGAISVTSPMYVAELAHKSIRGTLGTFFQVQITLGLLFEYVLGAIITDFKLLALVSSLVPLIFLLFFSLMPETPVYHIARNNPDAARKSLEFFRGAKYRSLADELLKLRAERAEASPSSARLGDLLESRATIKALIISLGLMLFQQLSGINAVLFYAGRIFADTGSSMAPNSAAILVGVVQVIATLLSTVLVDKAGRKLLLFTSAFVMSFCLISLGVYFHLKTTNDLSHLTIVPLICLAIYIVVFSIGLGPIPWMMMGELFAPKVKSLAGALSAAVNWLLAFIVTNQFANLVAQFGPGATFVAFGVVCALGAVFVVGLVPETKGKELEEVLRMLNGEDKVGKGCGRVCGDYKCCKAQFGKTTTV